MPVMLWNDRFLLQEWLSVLNNRDSHGLLQIIAPLCSACQNAPGSLGFSINSRVKLQCVQTIPRLYKFRSCFPVTLKIESKTLCLSDPRLSWYMCQYSLLMWVLALRNWVNCFWFFPCFGFSAEESKAQGGGKHELQHSWCPGSQSCHPL